MLLLSFSDANNFIESYVITTNYLINQIFLSINVRFDN
jgi:hypothetical protein